MKKLFPVLIDGVEVNVQAQIVGQKIWFKLNHEVYSCDLSEITQSYSNKSKKQSRSADRIIAPMPGKITKVFVKQGQKVNTGDALLVMEAMKMEYTLKSDLSAEVEKISAEVGQQVTLGQLLVQLKIQT